MPATPEQTAASASEQDSQADYDADAFEDEVDPVPNTPESAVMPESAPSEQTAASASEQDGQAVAATVEALASVMVAIGDQHFQSGRYTAAARNCMIDWMDGQVGSG